MPRSYFDLKTSKPIALQARYSLGVPPPEHVDDKTMLVLRAIERARGAAGARTRAVDVSLWEGMLLPDVLRLPDEVARVLDDPVFFARRSCRSSTDRPRRGGLPAMR